MLETWAVAGAAAGLLAGTALRPVARRLAAVPDPARLAVAGRPGRGAGSHVPTRPRAAGAGRCRRGGGPGPAAAGPRLRWTPVVTAVVLGLLGGRLGGQPELLAYGVLAVVGVALAFVDAAAHRLPDALVLPAYPAVLAGLAMAAGIRGDGGRLLMAVAASLVLAGCYLVLVLARPSELGLGDLKLAGLLGLALGWLGWPALLAGSLLAFALFALCALVLLAAGRAGRRTALPFGPFLLAAALLVILAA